MALLLWETVFLRFDDLARHRRVILVCELFETNEIKIYFEQCVLEGEDVSSGNEMNHVKV